MNANQIRIEMSEKGWISEDSLTWMGWGNGQQYGYSFSFSRWDWHGRRLGFSASYGASTSDLSKMDECITKAAEKALRAWEMSSECPPDTLVDGTLWIDPYKLKMLNDLWSKKP